jgi:septal ring factor EnvC (AmiA/AmiB activator)
MSQADELLNSLDEGIAIASVDPETEPHIVIDNDRNITVPDELRRIAVQYDHNIETVTFDCPRYWDGHDLSKMTIYINYMRADGEKGFFVAENVTVDSDTDIMHFTWTISKNVTMYKGSVSFLVCITSVDDGGNEELHWNSELCNQISVSEGLECHDAVEEEYPDIYTQLVDLVNANTFSDYYKNMIYQNASDIGVHTNEISILNNNISNMQTGLSATVSRVSNVESDLANYYTKTETDSTISSLQTDINGLNAQVNYMSEYKADTTTVSANTTAISELDTRVTANENGVSRNSSDINALSVSINKLQDADTQFSKDIASLNQTSTIAKSRADEALARNEFTDAEKSKLAGITNPMVIKGTVTSVSKLPTTAEIGWFYFVGAADAEVYDEYCYSQNGWEYIGTSQEGVDLTDYYTKSETDAAITAFGNVKLKPVENKVDRNTQLISVNTDNISSLQTDINGLNAQVEYMSEHKASTTTVSANTTAISELDMRVTEVESKAKSNASNINAVSASITNLQNADMQFSKDIAAVNATATIAKSKAETNQTDISENKSEITVNKSTLGYQKKNLFNLTNSVGSTTMGGITFTINADKTITLNGTATTTPWFELKETLDLQNKNLGGCKYSTGLTQNADSGCYVNISYYDANWSKQSDQIVSNNDVILNSEYAYATHSIVVTEGTTLNNVVVKPMVRLPDITDTTFEPYVKSVDERLNKFETQKQLHNNTTGGDSPLTVTVSNLFTSYSAAICNVVTSSEKYSVILPLRYIKSLGTSTYYTAEDLIFYYVDDSNIKISTGLGQTNPTISSIKIVGLY